MNKEERKFCASLIEPIMNWSYNPITEKGKVFINNIEITDSESWGKILESLSILKQENQQLKANLKESMLNSYKQGCEYTKNLYEQALIDIREYAKSTGLYETNINPDEPNIYNLELVRINDKILQIIDKVLGGNNE